MTSPSEGVSDATKIIFALDTSTGINTLALCRAHAAQSGWLHNGEAQVDLLAESVVACDRGHGERLLDTVDWILNEANLHLDEVDWFAVAKGPGSFTGLRIGAATWKGLAFAQQAPLIAVSTLDAMTRLSLFQDLTVCPLLDARMKEVFGAVYRFEGSQRTKLREDHVGPLADFFPDLAGPLLFLGDGAILYQDLLRQAFPEARIATGPFNAPHASAVAIEAVHAVAAGVRMDAALVEPVYLRKSQAEINRAKAQAPGEA